MRAKAALRPPRRAARGMPDPAGAVERMRVTRSAQGAQFGTFHVIAGSIPRIRHSQTKATVQQRLQPRAALSKVGFWILTITPSATVLD
jgi:hypothetical protein